MDRWVGKVAIVTGASAGMGVAICEELLSHGLTVAGLARRKERLEGLAQKWTNLPGHFHPVKCDLANQSDITTTFDWITNNLGPISVLVNNAGIAKPGTLLEADNQTLKSTFDTNVLALTITTREAIRNMRANTIDGYVINIGSIAGHWIEQNLSNYPASKHAAKIITEGFRLDLDDLESNIKVSAISPGLTDTEIFDANNFWDQAQLKERITTKPMLSGKDIADAVVYLLSTPPNVHVCDMIIRPIGKRQQK